MERLGWLPLLLLLLLLLLLEAGMLLVLLLLLLLLLLEPELDTITEEFCSIPRVSVPKLGRGVMMLVPATETAVAPPPPPPPPSLLVAATAATLLLPRRVPVGGEYIGNLITLSGNKGATPPPPT